MAPGGCSDYGAGGVTATPSETDAGLQRLSNPYNNSEAEAGISNVGATVI